MTIHLRPGRIAFRFAGPDAQTLLNDVVTGHIEAVAGPARWWALLSPQGKIQAEGLAGFADGAFYLDVDAGAAEAFFKRMKMYRLRAKVEITDLGQSHKVGWSPEPVSGLCHADLRAGGLGYRVIDTADEAKGWDQDESPFVIARLSAGIAEQGPDFAPDTSFAHDIGMDLLDGIDFAKGCYVGQEVVSRMKHRGTARRRPVLVTGDHLLANAPVLAGEREAGTLGAVQDGKGLAILRLDRITDPQAVSVDGAPVRVALPAWASYAFGESAPAD